jgi:biopolymer transport protein ExbB
MKKVFALLTVTGMLTFGTFNSVYAQNDAPTEEAVDAAEGEEAPAEEPVEAPVEEAAPIEAPAEGVAEAPAEDLSFTQVIKQKFIEGGPGFMGIVLGCLILGLAIVIERIIYLNMATTNTNKLLNNIESALNSGGVEAAKEVCRDTKGPVASIFYQGLDRSSEGIDMVEKSIVSYGGVQMGLLEKGISWISLFIALAPMLGFMGTVIGMIGAFDAIAEAGDISPQVVAVGIKVALLTTVFGLIVAIILQIFFNYIIAKVDNIVNDMENASISLVDMLVKNELTNK